MPVKIQDNDIASNNTDEKNYEFIVRKQYTDILGGLIYTLGCSLVHLALFIAIFMVMGTNLDKARDLDNKFKELILKNNKEFPKPH